MNEKQIRTTNTQRKNHARYSETTQNLEFDTRNQVNRQKQLACTW